MNKSKLTAELRATADILQPLIRATSSKSLSWDGTKHAKSGEADTQPNAYALAWWSKLISIAALIDAQDSPLSGKQIEFLRHTLFGGMGSFSDFSVIPDIQGVNVSLAARRRALFELFDR